MDIGSRIALISCCRHNAHLGLCSGLAFTARTLRMCSGLSHRRPQCELVEKQVRESQIWVVAPFPTAGRFFREGGGQLLECSSILLVRR